MYKRGDSWYSDFWYEGERYTDSLGPVSKTVAKEKDRKFRSDVAGGKYIKLKNNPLFEDAVEDFLKWSKVHNKPNSYTANKYRAVHLKAFFNGRRVRMIEGNQILMLKFVQKRKREIKAYQMKKSRTEAEVTYTTINRELALLRKMFNELIAAKKATRNPVSLVTMFDEFERETILEPDEQARIFQAIANSDKRYQHMPDIIMIGLNTAMRLGEILGMERKWIDLKSGIITVPRFSQKRGRKDKRVPINSAIRPIITGLLKQNKGNKYLLVNPKTGTRYTSIQNAWDHILKEARLYGKPGVDKLRLHDLRHTAATNLARAGKDIKFIAQYLGHADVKTTARYIHYSDEDLKTGSESLAGVPLNFTTDKIRSA